jgi:hypothetical protein
MFADPGPGDTPAIAAQQADDIAAHKVDWGPPVQTVLVRMTVDWSGVTPVPSDALRGCLCWLVDMTSSQPVPGSRPGLGDENYAAILVDSQTGKVVGIYSGRVE